MNCCQLDILLSEAKSILKDALVVLKILVSGFLYILKKILQFSKDFYVDYIYWYLLCSKLKQKTRFIYLLIIHLKVTINSFSSVQSLSRVWLFATPWIAACHASLSITNSRSSPKPTSIESVMPSSHLILYCPLLLLPLIPPSIRAFSNESTLRMRWPQYWSFSFSIIPSKEHQGLISFRIDWFDLLTVQGNRKTLLQHHSSKASILQHSAFFTVQLSHPYVTTGKTIALTRWTFGGKVMSLLLICYLGWS